MSYARGTLQVAKNILNVGKTLPRKSVVPTSNKVRKAEQPCIMNYTGDRTQLDESEDSITVVYQGREQTFNAKCYFGCY
jgi:hypothetical protein